MDNKKLKVLSILIPTWSSFMVAARTDFIQQNKKIIRAILSAFQEAAKLFHNNKDYSIEIVSKSYNLSKGDSEKWINSVRYS
ncbi:MAG: hypothetical protein WA421_07520, partial [Nitrososphaeraceae archaeon]